MAAIQHLTKSKHIDLTNQDGIQLNFSSNQGNWQFDSSTRSKLQLPKAKTEKL